MIETEPSLLGRQRLSERFPFSEKKEEAEQEVTVLLKQRTPACSRRNGEKTTVHWQFTTEHL